MQDVKAKTMEPVGLITEINNALEVAKEFCSRIDEKVCRLEILVGVVALPEKPVGVSDQRNGDLGQIADDVKSLKAYLHALEDRLAQVINKL